MQPLTVSGELCQVEDGGALDVVGPGAQPEAHGGRAHLPEHHQTILVLCVRVVHLEQSCTRVTGRRADAFADNPGE